MKKNWMILWMIAALLASVCAFASAEQSADDDTAWFELGDDQRVVTIRVPSMLNDGCEWRYAISNENVLELLTSEDTADESEDGTGEFAVSFLSTAKNAGDVAITIESVSEIGAVEAYTLELSVAKSGAIKVAGYSIYDGMGDWLTLTDEACVISVNLPADETTGYAWRYAISNDKLVANTSETYIPGGEDGGVWNALFQGTLREEGDNGDVTLTFRYQKGDDAPIATCVAQMWLSENGQFDIVTAMAAISSITDVEMAR